MTVGDDVNAQPYLETDCQKGCYCGYAGLQEKGLEACCGCDMGYDHHYHEHEILPFFAVADGDFGAVRTGDCREGAEEH